MLNVPTTQAIPFMDLSFMIIIKIYFISIKTKVLFECDRDKYSIAFEVGIHLDVNILYVNTLNL